MTDVKALTNLPDTIREEMYDKLDFNKNERRFLDPKYGAKFMTYFEVGNEKLVMYGNPVRMAEKSEVVASLLDTSPPFQLASDITAYGGAIMVLWLYLNGFDIEETDRFGWQRNKLARLSIGGLLNFYHLTNHLNVEIYNEKTDKSLLDHFLATLGAAIVRDKEAVKKFSGQIGAIINKIVVSNQKVDAVDAISRIFRSGVVEGHVGYAPIIAREIDKLLYKARTLAYRNRLLGWIPKDKLGDIKEVAAALNKIGAIKITGLVYIDGKSFIVTIHPSMIVLYNVGDILDIDEDEQDDIDKYKIDIPREYTKIDPPIIPGLPL